MNEILKSAHSGWRYVVLLLLIAAVFQALGGWTGKKSYSEGNRKLNLFTLISAHIQLLLGLALYFLNGWFRADSSAAIARYWKMEHISMMLLAVILITVGNARSKKGADGVAKHKTIAIFFGIALVLVLVAIYLMTKSDPSRTFFGVS
ncbi:cytochrome B [Pedobacter yulinensis]|uniref:Cytochrome B n=1 Tax=Pedobacter yulinensis TaxID=2126353 RepID=A0A2T3HRY1_9SPHI|nr:cytochrome B [Pedobacter yulinensis]PST85198.1 cytochrome B [Pedobacter yulinensis]